jgi:tetratricopeptide (TPR) repeat protein
MQANPSSFFVAAAVLVLGVASLNGCNSAGTESKPSSGAGANSTAGSGKLAVTTSSEEARKEFLQGRDLAERLLAQDSLAHFDKAIQLDPQFAYAELGRATASPTAKEFFDHLKKATSVAGKASEGERLLILATEAGANGEAAKQKEYLEKLVAIHPNEERAHFQLGGYYFGEQDFSKAIEHYKKATELAPQYSPAYNILGYAYRQKGDFLNAETAFKKYIELIPKDPNPYDSYAELLLKMGKFDESIAQYRKALAIDPKFFASNVGIASALTYMGKPDEATAELQKITDNARSDGDRRTALFGSTVVNVDSGKLDKALADVDKQYAIAEKINDVAAMTGDLQNRGTILLEMGKHAEAKEAFEKLLQMTEASSLSNEIKENTRLFHHYNLATVALLTSDIKTAKTEAEEYRKGATKNPAQVRQAHQLAGMIALAEKAYDQAIAELEQTGDQNPQNLFRLAQAYQGKGDSQKAKELYKKVAEFNSLPALNYAIVRAKAKKEIAT